jgi:hypothetical protein
LAALQKQREDAVAAAKAANALAATPAKPEADPASN